MIIQVSLSRQMFIFAVSVNRTAVFIHGRAVWAEFIPYMGGVGSVDEAELNDRFRSTTVCCSRWGLFGYCDGTSEHVDRPLAHLQPPELCLKIQQTVPGCQGDRKPQLKAFKCVGVFKATCWSSKHQKGEERETYLMSCSGVDQNTSLRWEVAHAPQNRRLEKLHLVWLHFNCIMSSSVSICSQNLRNVFNGLLKVCLEELR